jgi:glycerophosphoryl diester phosphodiesterase
LSNPFNLPEQAIIGHRGASAHAPENTLPSFELALTQGADALELDVVLTRDGQIAVIHDDRLERTTDGSGSVKESEWADLRQLDAGSSFSPAYAGARIPLLRDVLEAFAAQTIINVELKNNAALFNDLPERVAVLIQELKVEERVFISSFNPVAMRRFHRVLPDIPLGLLALGGGVGMGHWLMPLVPHQAIHPNQRVLSEDHVRRAQAAGKRVHTYTVNSENDIQRLFEWGVNAIFTDEPGLAFTIRRKDENAPL